MVAGIPDATQPNSAAAEIDRRHIADSLQLVALLPAQGIIADLGSGGGLPGIVIAAALPDRVVHLVESDRRKAAFLIEAAGTLKLPHVTIHARRIEQAVLPPVARHRLRSAQGGGHASAEDIATLLRSLAIP